QVGVAQAAIIAQSIEPQSRILFYKIWSERSQIYTILTHNNRCIKETGLNPAWLNLYLMSQPGQPSSVRWAHTEIGITIAHPFTCVPEGALLRKCIVSNRQKMTRTAASVTNHGSQQLCNGHQNGTPFR